MTDPRTVFLRPAWEWTCPLCGSERFERAAIVQNGDEAILARAEDQDEAREAMERFGLDGDWLTAPDHVTCSACGERFGVEVE